MSEAELYTDRLKALAGQTAPPLPDPAHGRARASTPLCGDRVEVALTLEHGRVAALGHHTRGCLVCRAAAAALAGGVTGRDRAELAATLEALGAFLAHGQAPPDWPDLDVFAPARAHPSRRSCVTLPFQVALSAMDAAMDAAVAASSLQTPAFPTSGVAMDAAMDAAVAASSPQTPASSPQTPASSPQTPASAPPVAAVILAAGSSRRMGDTDKLSLMWAGVPMLRHVVATVRACPGLDPVVVVVGPGERGRHLAALVADLGVRVVVNGQAGEGQATSLRAGIAALPAEVGAAMVFLADMPRVGEADITALLAHWPAPGRDALRPVVGGRPGHPVLLGRALFGAVGALDGDQGARALLGGAPDRVLLVPMASDGVIVDIDTAEQYADALKETAKG